MNHKNGSLTQNIRQLISNFIPMFNKVNVENKYYNPITKAYLIPLLLTYLKLSEPAIILILLFL